MTGPSQAMPSQARSVKMPATNCARERPMSISSIRRRNRPPQVRARSKPTSADNAWPRCSSPLGLGAKRKIGGPLVISPLHPFPRIGCSRRTAVIPCPQVARACGDVMLDFLGHGRRQPKSEAFGQLTIERRILITPRSTISIPNIATISSGTITVPSKLVWVLVLALLVAGIGALTYASTRPGFVEAAAGAAMVLAALVLARFFSRTEKPCLFISSSDGHTSLFTGQHKTLEEVRRLLSDKINADDENAIYRINFEKVVVQTVSLAPGASVGAIVAGSGNHVMAGFCFTDPATTET